MPTHNTYFDGKVQSLGFERHGLKATVGVLDAGTYEFSTGAPERMSIVSGAVKVRLEGRDEWLHYPGGTVFELPGDSRFHITALDGPAAYLCEFL